MLKVLIICKRLENAKKITNNIVSKLADLQLIGIANNYAEAKNILIENQADVIITTDSHIISFINEEFFYYSPGIVIIDRILQLKESYRKILLINNTSKYEEIVDLIRFFIHNKVENSHKEKVQKILKEIGFNFKLSGTIYLLDAILYVHSYKGSYSFEKLNKDVYSYIGAINNTTAYRVKWAIERMLKYYYEDEKSDFTIIEKYFDVKYPQKITPKLVISVLANLLDIINC